MWKSDYLKHHKCIFGQDNSNVTQCMVHGERKNERNIVHLYLVSHTSLSPTWHYSQNPKQGNSLSKKAMIVIIMFVQWFHVDSGCPLKSESVLYHTNHIPGTWISLLYCCIVYESLTFSIYCGEVRVKLVEPLYRPLQSLLSVQYLLAYGSLSLGVVITTDCHQLTLLFTVLVVWLF